MKVESRLEKFVFTSYDDLKRHRNDKDLTIYGTNGPLFLYTPKELKDNDYSVPTGWDRSDYALYFERYNNSHNFDFVAIENIELDDIYALRRIVP